MKLIPKVAKTELKNLFFSPIAWFLLIVFVIQSAVTYLGILDRYVSMQEAGGDNLNYLAPLTYKIFADPMAGMFLVR